MNSSLGHSLLFGVQKAIKKHHQKRRPLANEAVLFVFMDGEDRRQDIRDQRSQRYVFFAFSVSSWQWRQSPEWQVISPPQD
jgi:hypothetical protein